MDNNKQPTGINIKQRITGAIVLVSLGVIIIPLLLNGGTDSQQAIYGSNIPPVPPSLNKTLPEIKPLQTMPAPEPVESRPVEYLSVKAKGNSAIKKTVHENVKQVSKRVNINQNKTPVESPPATVFIKAKAPQSKKITAAYTLQIASFGNKENAFLLRNKLRKQRYKAYIESVSTVKGKRYRLRVGPYLKYDQLLAIQKKIEQKFKLNKTIIVKYKI